MKNNSFLQSLFSSKIMILLCLLTLGSTAWAQWTDPISGVTFTPISGTGSHSFTDNEGAAKACDGNAGTKMGSNASSFPVNVVIQASSAVKISGYSITTANDNATYTNRNPKNWTVSGSNDNSTWTTIATVSNDAILKDVNNKTYFFSCTSSQAYTYFKFEVTANQGNGYMQFSEFHPLVSVPTSSTANGYVIFASNRYLPNTTTATTTFSPSTCLWTLTSNKLMNGVNYLRTNSDEDEIRIGPNNTRNGIALSGTESGTTGQTIKINNSLYLRYNSGWKGTTNSSDATACLFAVTKNTYSESATNPAFSGADQFSDSEVGTTKNYTITTNASYRLGFINYVFYNNTDHFFKSDNSTSITTPPAAEGITYTWELSSNAAGHVSVNTSGAVTYNTVFEEDTYVTLTLKATSNTSNHVFTSATKTILFEAPRIDPTGVTASNMTLYVGNSQPANVTLTPNPCYRNLEFTSSNTGIATVTNAGVLTGVAVGTTTVNVKAYKIGNTDYLSTTFNVTVKDKVATPVISYEPNNSNDGATATTTLTCATSGATIYYTTNGDEPTTSSTPYTTTFTVNNNQTVKAIAVKNVTGWDNSDIATLTYVKRVLPTPTIEMSNGSVTFTCTEPGVTFYYTTNGTTPTASSTAWTGPTAITGLTNECTIKVIATKSGWIKSDVASRQYIMASGASGSVVTLNDYEDHNWKYYTGEDVNVGSTTYKEKYKYIIYSPDPRNVKITYRSYNTANNTIILGTSSVSASSDALKPVVSVADGENQNTFVYYKTLEKFVIGMFTDNADWNGIPDDPTNVNEQYPYLTISNPFSKRPKYGDNYYGFAGWKIISGGDHILEYDDNDVIPLDAIIHFNDLNTGYTPNCTSASIVLEATWKVASVYTGTTTPTSTTFPSTNTYETNFWVLPGNITSNITISYPCTIMGIDPNGANNNSTSRTLSANLTVGNNAVDSSINNHVKLEWMKIGNVTIDANGNDLTIGRGITSTGTRVGTVQGVNSDRNSVNTVIVESGSFSVIRNNGSNDMDASRDCNIYTILGCDYDRSRADYFVNDPSTNPYNTKLTATQIRGSAGGENLNRDAGELYIRTTVKSGTFMTKVGDEEYYFHAYQHLGQRCMEFQGGYLKSGIKGGSERHENDDFEQPNNRSMTIRIKGNTRIDGQIAGGSTARPCSGDRVYAVTGGRILGWIAPGSNCSTNTEGLGATDGESYVYFGGNARIDSRQFGNAGTNIIGHSTGGVIYGAGLGTSRNSTTIGQMSQGTNIVLADNAYTERGIYGGGAMGTTLATANIFILGGHVGTGTGTIKDEAITGSNQNVSVPAGVFGGACNVGGENSFIYMNGGLVESGIYGGSNNIGNMSGNATIQINGGQVGKDASHTANVHGGGLGNATRVLGNVSVAVGKLNTDNTVEGDAVIYGDVYGGSAQGKTNGNTALTTGKTTQVTINSGTINGSVYGGGLGNATYAADVWGPVTVTVNGGKICSTSSDGSGAVFGCNNANGRPQGKVNVNVTGGEMEYVYGGGNAAAYTGDPTVSVTGGTVHQHVFGGGLGADIAGNTSVTVKGTANIKKNVYGGGSEGNVSGNTEVIIGEVPVP